MPLSRQRPFTIELILLTLAIVVGMPSLINNVALYDASHPWVNPQCWSLSYSLHL